MAKIKNYYRIDLYLVLLHFILFLMSVVLYQYYPRIPPEQDMSGIFFMAITFLGGIVALIILTIALTRLDKSIPHLPLYKFILAFLYWFSSSIIFIFFSLNIFLFNQPLQCIFIFGLIFFSSIYLSIIRLADMRKKDYLILLAIFGSFFLFIFFVQQ